MARKARTVYICDGCGAESARWEGRCPQCGEWNTLAEFKPDPSPRTTRGWSGTTSPEAVNLKDVKVEEAGRAAVGSPEFIRVLGGGIVPGSVVLVAGDPGIGKSTLLLDVASDAAQRNPVLYVAGEESAAQVKMRADRLGIDVDGLYLLPAIDLADIMGQMDTLRPSLVIVDSIQTVFTGDLDAVSGSVAQIRECAGRLTQWAKLTGTPVILTGHVTKSGDIAGPRILEHAVDVVLQLEGDPVSAFRLLRSVKNRFGSTNEVGVFEMTEQGMQDVADPSARLISQHSTDSIGTLIVPAVVGTRSLLVEVQALTNPSLLPTPRRVASGVDYNRLLLVCAVLTRRAGMSLASQDVIVNVAGGIRVSEPAADLALALAIISSVRDVPLAQGTVAFGEIGLSGEVRPVSQHERRIAEAARLGLGRCLVPSVRDGVPQNGEVAIDTVPVSSLRQAVRSTMPSKRVGRPEGVFESMIEEGRT